MAQLIRLTSLFIESGKIVIQDDLFSSTELRRRVLIMLNINRIVQHFWNELRAENTERLTPVFDSENPILSTSKMRTWYTKKPCEYNQKSHINHTVIDGTWEATEAFILDKSKHVKSWVKNDHLGFTILYNYGGAIGF